MSAFLSLLLLLSSPLRAEVPPAPATVRGMVLDAGGAPIAGATVEVLGTDPIRTVTDEQGEFTLECLLPARLLISHPSYDPETVRLASSETSVEARLRSVAALRETLLVVAEQLGDQYSPNSISSVAFDPLDAGSSPSTLAESLTRVSGVAENGQGGLFQVFSVRGLSRQRLISLFSGIRLTSERRAGVSASFIDPVLIGEVDVQRGPASTYYGSGALGGAIQLLPRHYERLEAAIGYDSAGDENYQHAAWGDRRWSLGVARRAASDAESPDGERLFSRFEQVSAVVTGRLQHGYRSSDLLLAASHGSDIGKPSSDFPGRATLYPRERHVLARYAISAATWQASAYVHPHDLTTEVITEGTSLEVVDNETFDFGSRFVGELPLGDRLSGRAGLELFGRRGVDAAESSLDFGSLESSETQTLRGAHEEELGAFAVVNWEWGGIRWEIGTRATHEVQGNGASADGLEQKRLRSAVTGFLGIGAPVTQRLQLIANLGTGLRFPSLTEQFFVGATGRGQVIGNPLLEEESALNAELGARWFGDHAYVGATVFRNTIDDYIERVELDDDTRTFVNLESGTIDGVELDGFVDFAERRWRVELGYHRIEGAAENGGALADVPPDQARLGARRFSARWSWRGDLRWRGAKDDVGPGERSIPSAWLLETAVSYRLKTDLELTLGGVNLLDETHFGSADEKATPAPGRSLTLTLSWRGD